MATKEDALRTQDRAGSESVFAHRGALYAGLILALVAVGSAAALSIDGRFVYALVYVWFGVIYGLLLQYGRFCMASAVRDLFAVGVPRMAVGVMIAVVLFSLTSALVTVAGASTFSPSPLGWHVLIGGLIFGFGIVLTGGCASGSLYKSGEGNVGAMLVVLAISFSQAVFVSAGGWFGKLVPQSWVERSAEIWMPEELKVSETWFDLFLLGYIEHMPAATVADLMGATGTVYGAFVGNAFISSILPVLLILVVLYHFYFRKGYLRRAKIESPTLGDHLRGIWAMITTSKNTALAGLGLGVFAGLQMYITGAMRDHYRILNFGDLLADMGYEKGLSLQYTVFDPGYWYITTQEAQWGGWVMHLFGAEMMENVFFGLDNGIPNPLLNAPGLMSIGIIFGAAVLALTRKEFKWKLPNMEVAVLAIVGGTLMGIGARVGMGCNVGAFFASVTNGDLTGWVFAAGMTLGAFFGVKAFTWWMERKAAKEEGAFDL